MRFPPAAGYELQIGIVVDRAIEDLARRYRATWLMD